MSFFRAREGTDEQGSLLSGVVRIAIAVSGLMFSLLAMSLLAL